MSKTSFKNGRLLEAMLESSTYSIKSAPKFWCNNVALCPYKGPVAPQTIYYISNAINEKVSAHSFSSSWSLPHRQKYVTDGEIVFNYQDVPQFSIQGHTINMCITLLKQPNARKLCFGLIIADIVTCMEIILPSNIFHLLGSFTYPGQVFLWLTTMRDSRKSRDNPYFMSVCIS